MPGTILIVDDARDLRRLLARAFAMHGYRVCEAASAAEGLALLNGGRETTTAAGAADGTADGGLPDLVVLDFMMPEMNGVEMLRLMRASPRTARVPVIMWSAWQTPEHIAAALAE